MIHFLVGFRQILQGLVHFFTDSPKEDIWPFVVCVFFAFMENNMFLFMYTYISLLVGTLFGYIIK